MADATIETANPAAAERADPHASARPNDERARARAYLDLWERHLAQAATRGPAAPAAPRS